MWQFLFELDWFNHWLRYFETGWNGLPLLLDLTSLLVNLKIKWRLFNFEIGSNCWIFRCSATTDADTSIKMATRLAEPRLNQYFANILHGFLQFSNIGCASGLIISCKNIPQEIMRFWGLCLHCKKLRRSDLCKNMFSRTVFQMKMIMMALTWTWAFSSRHFPPTGVLNHNFNLWRKKLHFLRIFFHNICSMLYGFLCIIFLTSFPIFQCQSRPLFDHSWRAPPVPIKHHRHDDQHKAPAWATTVYNVHGHEHDDYQYQQWGTRTPAWL